MEVLCICHVSLICHSFSCFPFSGIRCFSFLINFLTPIKSSEFNLDEPHLLKLYMTSTDRDNYFLFCIAFPLVSGTPVCNT